MFDVIDRAGDYCSLCEDIIMKRKRNRSAPFTDNGGVDPTQATSFEHYSKTMGRWSSVASQCRSHGGGLPYVSRTSFSLHWRGDLGRS